MDVKKLRTTNRKSKYTQGKYLLKHPEKYMGDPETVWYMSSWELRFHEFLDNNSSILKWTSEEIKIPYIHPLDGSMHWYFPDYFIIYKDSMGRINKELIEIKPAKQMKIMKNARAADKITVMINHAKWEAAAKFCKAKNITFRILNEHDLFGRKQT
jgi:hypothetical protein